jgi:hypothetical protein
MGQNGPQCVVRSVYIIATESPLPARKKTAPARGKGWGRQFIGCYGGAVASGRA